MPTLKTQISKFDGTVTELEKNLGLHDDIQAYLQLERDGNWYAYRSGEGRHLLFIGRYQTLSRQPLLTLRSSATSHASTSHLCQRTSTNDRKTITYSSLRLAPTMIIICLVIHGIIWYGIHYSLGGQGVQNSPR